MPSHSRSGDSIGILPKDCKPVKRTTSQQSQSADQPVSKKKKIVIRPRGGAVADVDGGPAADAPPTREPSVDLVILNFMFSFGNEIQIQCIGDPKSDHLKFWTF